MRRPPRAHLPPPGRGKSGAMAAAGAAAHSALPHAGPAFAGIPAPQAVCEAVLAPGGRARAAHEPALARSGPALLAPSEPGLAAAAAAAPSGPGRAAQAQNEPDLAAGAAAVTPAARARSGCSGAAQAASLATPASCARQGSTGVTDPHPGPVGARGAPAPCLMTPATGGRRGRGMAVDPSATPGSAVTPAPRLTVQFLPADSAAAASVAAAGGNPHLELDCKCAFFDDRHGPGFWVPGFSG